MATPFPRGMGIRQAGPAPQMAPQGNIYGDIADVARAGEDIVGDVQQYQEGEDNRKRMIDEMVYKRQVAQQAREAQERFKQADMDFNLAKEAEDTRQFEVGEARDVRAEESETRKREEFDKKIEKSESAWDVFKTDIKEEMGPVQPGVKRRLPPIDRISEIAVLSGILDTKEGRERFKSFAQTQGMSDYQTESLLDKQELAKRSQEARDRAEGTKFVKNTQDIADELSIFNELDKALPGGIYGTGGITGFGLGSGATFRKLWKSEEMGAIRPTLQMLINKILKRQSGAAVSDQEFERLNTQFGIDASSTVEEFRKGLQNYYENARRTYDDYRTFSPEAASQTQQISRLSGSPSGGSEVGGADPLGIRPTTTTLEEVTVTEEDPLGIY